MAKIKDINHALCWKGYGETKSLINCCPEYLMQLLKSQFGNCLKSSHTASYSVILSFYVSIQRLAHAGS